jgi:pyruvate formate lyase activating enzyme
MNTAALLFNIQRFSIHDGPGIRTTVFLKGCGMRCFWCHNPEGRHSTPELLFFPDRCIACGECVAACPSNAHQLAGGVHIFDRTACRMSGECVARCCSGALEIAGTSMTVDEVMAEVLRDRPFYTMSGGGVTLSGGEPGFQDAFVRALLDRCKAEQIHTAIETCGYCSWDALAAILPATDLVMMDIKLVSREDHLNATGRPNDRILDNAVKLALTEIPIVFRTPVVPSVNDTEDEIGQIAAFVRSLVERRRLASHKPSPSAPITYELLPFHALGAHKHTSLGLKCSASSLTPPSRERMLELAGAARRNGMFPRVR